MPERRLVWTPDVIGSLAFLVSAALGIVAVTAVVGLFELRSRDWQAEWINMIGCVAFGVSTFIGALCFLVAALLVLPRKERTRADKPGP